MLELLSGSGTLYDHNQTERDRVLAQDGAEIFRECKRRIHYNITIGDYMLLDGVVGNRFSKDVHPRRRAFLHAMRYVYLAHVQSRSLKVSYRLVLAIVVLFLDIRYWYTRTSTVSISILGTALLSGSDLFNKLGLFVIEQKMKEFSVLGFTSSLLLIMFTSLVLPLLMIKAILRIEFRWWKGITWVPIMQKAGATHRERASERLEAATSWRVKAGVRRLVTVFSMDCSCFLPALPFDRSHLLCPHAPQPIRDTVPYTRS